MKNIRLNVEHALPFVNEEVKNGYMSSVKALEKSLEEATCAGNDFLGWLHLPSSITKEHLDDIKATAEILRKDCEIIVVAGIGGSYLGARAVIEALSHTFPALVKHAGPTIIFAGQNISEDYLYELKEALTDRKFGIINISKSGTTTETALSFRILKELCERQCGKEFARKHIVAITDAKIGRAHV